MNEIAKPLITTIIPTYRRPKLLRRAIMSVLNQTYPHFQVCVYDNASGDETAYVVAEMAKADARVKYYCHSENIGAVRNFIYGMEHVETPFFSFLSDDDILLPEFYETAMKGFDEFTGAMFSACSSFWVTDKGKARYISLHLWERDGYYTPPDGLFEIMKDMVTWTSALFRKEVIEKVGVLDQEVDMAADLDFELRIAAHFPFVISLKPGAIYMIHSAASFAPRFHYTWPGWLKMIRNLTGDKRLPLDIRIHVERVLTARLKKRLFAVGFRAIMRRDFEDAYRSSEILRDYYHLKSRAFFLSFMATFCRFCFPVRYFIVSLDKIRQFLKQNRQLQKQFIDYIRLLES